MKIKDKLKNALLSIIFPYKIYEYLISILAQI